MAGYLIAVGGEKAKQLSALKKIVETGVYSTLVKTLSPGPFEGTLTDYLSMKEGDNIYFFCDRKIYGVGKLVSINDDCKYCNYIDSTTLQTFQKNTIQSSLIIDYGNDSWKYRWFCIFEGDPYFFEEGIDMDEALRYKPSTFKMLRAFWKLSFIKLGDEENTSLKELIYLKHQHELRKKTGILPENKTVHAMIQNRQLNNHIISPYPLLAGVTAGQRVKHEMALEATVVFDLCHGGLEELLGCWDYVSHQVIASPFKPVDYMDKIDVFAARYLEGTTIQCKYLVAELKKDSTGCETIDQVLKYVDWVCNEYAYGDYESIQACIIAAEFESGIDEYYSQVVQRSYIVGSHPAKNKKWNALKLIEYSYVNGVIQYIDKTPVIP